MAVKNKEHFMGTFQLRSLEPMPTHVTLFFLCLLVIMPAIYVIYATFYMNGATYNLQSPRLAITGAPGQRIFFKCILKKNIREMRSGDPVVARLERVPETLPVIPTASDTWHGDSVLDYIPTPSNQIGDYAVTGVLTLPSTLQEHTEVHGTISGSMVYPEDIGNGGYYKDTTIIINTPITIHLVTPLELFFSRGDFLFYMLAILNILYMLVFYHLPGLRSPFNTYTRIKLRSHSVYRLPGAIFLPIVVLGLLSVGGIGIPGYPTFMPPWNEVALWGAAIAGALLLSTLIDGIRLARAFFS